ncbi:MAG: phosphatidylinositol kinase [Saprospirales bacterium]|nr:MAG: phosphatidylinositol kinase [Saprospirales bacterium]
MRIAKILYKNEVAGILRQLEDGSFEFEYHSHWVEDSSKPPISLTLPKRKVPYRSKYLFPFFYNMLPEGSNKQSVCFNQRIDKSDHFGVLMATAGNDAIGAVRVLKIEN